MCLCWKKVENEQDIRNLKLKQNNSSPPLGFLHCPNKTPRELQESAPLILINITASISWTPGTGNISDVIS